MRQVSSLDELIQLAQLHSLTYWTAGIRPFAYQPSDYLTLAHDALDQAGRSKERNSLDWEGKLISAWNFARQGLECRCDELLWSFGVARHTQWKKLDEKLKLVRHGGLDAPEGLVSLVRRRNDLYHRYAKPMGTEEKVLGDNLSLIEYFIKNSEQYLSIAEPGWGVPVLVAISETTPPPPAATAAQRGTHVLPGVDFSVLDWYADPDTSLIAQCYVAVDLPEWPGGDGESGGRGCQLRLIWTKPASAPPDPIAVEREKVDKMLALGTTIRNKGNCIDQIGGNSKEVYARINAIVVAALRRPTNLY